MTKDQRYHQPTSLEQAWDLLKRGPGSARAAWTGPKPAAFEAAATTAVVDLSQLGLRKIELEADRGRVTIGSMTTLNDLLQSEVLASLHSGILQRAARKTSHYGLRNLATLGGVLQDPRAAPEIAVALLASDGVLKLYDGSESELPLYEYLARDNGHPLGFPLGITFERSAAEVGAADIQWVVRSPMDQALVAAAFSCQVEAQTITVPRVAIAADGIPPQRLSELEEILQGRESKEIDWDEIRQVMEPAIKATGTFRCSEEYQHEMALVLTQRAIANAVRLEVPDEG